MVANRQPVGQIHTDLKGPTVRDGLSPNHSCPFRHLIRSYPATPRGEALRPVIINLASPNNFKSERVIDQRHHRWEKFRTSATRRSRFGIWRSSEGLLIKFHRHPDTPLLYRSPCHFFLGLDRIWTSPTVTFQEPVF